MRRTILLLSAAAVLCLATASQAREDFAPYEGRDAIQEGRGGTKVVKDGVEFWTMGTPPHRYRVLGVMSDTRGEGVFAGNVIGSSVAKRTRAAGGDAVIILGREGKVAGAMAFGNGVVGVVRKNTTQLLVVKYEDVAPERAVQ